MAPAEASAPAGERAAGGPAREALSWLVLATQSAAWTRASTGPPQAPTSVSRSTRPSCMTSTAASSRTRSSAVGSAPAGCARPPRAASRCAMSFMTFAMRDSASVLTSANCAPRPEFVEIQAILQAARDNQLGIPCAATLQRRPVVQSLRTQLHRIDQVLH